MKMTTIDFSIYETLIFHIKKQLHPHRPLILAIDGMCGSGKTTLAQYLSTIFQTEVIHMDNFFLPFERKTPERLAEAGGNIDYERFIEIVLPALQQRTPFSYVAYNCQTCAYDREIQIGKCELIIVEGSYSLHQKFGHYYDMSLFLSVDTQEQLQRLKDRCKNETKFQRFQTEWIPMETYYHEKQSVFQHVNMIINTTSLST